MLSINNLVEKRAAASVSFAGVCCVFSLGCGGVVVDQIFTFHSVDMSFLNNLFDATGCNPDGSLGQNAFTSFVDQTLNSHLFADENGSDFDQVPTYFLPEQEYDEGESQGQAAAPMSSYISQGGFMPMSSPMMMGMPSMMGMPPMMRMAPGWGFPQPMMMNYPMMGGNAPFMQNQMHQVRLFYFA